MFPRVLAVLGTALLSVGVAQAADEEKKPKRFSISFSTGIRPDMAQLGSTIAQDGSVDVADSSLASYYSIDKFLMSDRNNMTLDANSKKTDSIFNLQDGHQVGGSMLGVEFGGDLRYEFDDLINFPLFLKTGFYYTSKMSGGEQSRTLGDIVTQLPDTAQAVITGGTGNDIEDYVGGTMKTTWDASWWEIPINVGIKVPVKNRLFAYGYAGVSIFRGGFDITVNVDEKYANVLGTHVDTAEFSAVDLSPDGAVVDTISFRTTAVGLNYGLGTQVNIKKRFAVFMELNSSGAAKTVYGSKTKDSTKQLFTALSSELIANGSDNPLAPIEGDGTWFQDLAYPVVMQGASARIGIRAYLF